MDEASTPAVNALQRALTEGHGSLRRALVVERAAINEEARTAELAFASEAPYERYWGVEILDCAPGSMRLGRLKSGANLLCDHDMRDVVGVVESVSIGADRVGRCTVRFGRSARAEEVWQDVRDGIRRNVSVGYLIHAAQLVEQRDGVETYRVTDWEPFEVSLVSVPADASVGVGRSMQTVCVTVEVSGTDDTTSDDATTPSDPAEPQVASAPVPTPSTEDRTMSDPAVTIVEQRNHAVEITKIAASVPGTEAQAIALRSIQAGHTVEQFQAELLRSLSKPALPASQVGLTAAETQRFSITRAIRAMVDRDWSGAGFEREVSNAIMKRAGLSDAPNGGFFVPYEVQAKRDLTAGTASAGGYTVATDNLAGSFIELLRNRATVAQLGATMLTGLQGNVTIPKQTGATTAYWLSTEATTITESNMTFGQLALSPKQVGAYQEVSRQLLMQSSPSVDNLITNDLARVLALAIDLAAYEGTGSSGQPTGIANVAGIGSVTGSSLDYADILEFQTDVAGANALTTGCAYVTTPTVAALMMNRQRFSSTDSPLWVGSVLDGTMAGYRATSTLQVSSATMVFGDFSQVVIGEWGMLEIAMNPYASFTAAITGIRAIQSVDIGVRYAGAFSRATSIS